MTILKFRAWNKREQRMFLISDLDTRNQVILDNSYNIYPFDEVELMQSTGLYDKNGKEVFEGDIVVEEYHDSLNYGRVFYSEKKACYRVEFKNLVNGFDLADVAVKFVAGNVYENPELLEEEA